MQALLVGLDGDAAAVIRGALERRWSEAGVALVANAEATRAAVARESPSLLLIDAGALEGCREVYGELGVPVLAVMARGGALSRLEALRLGADDCLVRRFTEHDVQARVEAVLRLLHAHYPPGTEPAFEAGVLRIDYATRSVTVSGGGVRLSPAEYGLLYHLTRNANRVLSYRTLLAKVWGRAYVEELDYVRVSVEQLQRKIGLDSGEQPRIVSRRGLGYAFVRREWGGEPPLEAPAG